MNRALVFSSFAALVAACGGSPGGAGASSPSGGGDGPERPTSAQREATGKKMDEAQGKGRRDELKRYVDHYVSESKRQTADVEEKLLAGARVALGEEKARGAREQASFGANLAKLRAVGLHPKVASSGKKFQQGFLQLDGGAISAEWKSVPQAKNQEARYVVSDLSGQTQTLTWASYLASQQQIGLHLQAVAVTGAVIANRRKYSLEPSPDEVAIVKKTLDQARRGDEIAAAGAGLSAALVAVTNAGKAAKNLDDMARAVKEAIPSKATATDEEAKAYLDGFEAGLGDARERYESMLKKSYGDEWERSSMKSMLDQSFKIADEGTHQRTEADRRAEREKRAEERRAESGSHRASPSTGPAQASNLASTAKSLLPSDGPIGGAIGVVDALKNGDAKGALKGAIAFVPPGPIKTGLNLISSVF